MARITSYIPEPKQDYDVENQRQILRAVDTIKERIKFFISTRFKKRTRSF